MIPLVHGPAINGLVLVVTVKTIAIKIGQVMIAVRRSPEKSKIIVSFRVTVVLAIKKVTKYFLLYHVINCYSVILILV